MTRGSDTEKVVAIVDKVGITDRAEDKKNNLVLNYDYSSVEDAKAAYLDGKLDGVIELPALNPEQEEYNIIFHSDEQLALDETASLQSLFRKKIRNYKIEALGLDRSQLDKIDTDLTVEPKTVKNTEKEISSMTSMVGSGLGIIVCFILFFMILLYGSQVMKSVSEEKVNRIVEVLISSVKPFQLMMGKILGVGSVGLVQVMIWVLLMIVLSTVGFSVFGLSSLDFGADTAELTEAMSAQGINAGEKMAGVLKELTAINWGLIIPLYIFYFFVGYLTYSALFAAVGAAMGDDIQDAQTLVLVAQLPLIVGFYIAVSAFQAPNSTLAVWSSILPFTGPVVMPVRLAMDPPMWQIIASIVSSVVAVFALTWLAGRIYRVGILMYGKKASFKELGKWLFYSA